MYKKTTFRKSTNCDDLLLDTPTNTRKSLDLLEMSGMGKVGQENKKRISRMALKEEGKKSETDCRIFHG